MTILKRALFTTAFICLTGAQALGKPNIVFIYADDMGYGDVGVYNPNSQIPTPNIDRLAQQGMRFTDAHSSHATCTGSRYGLLTGTSSVRSGVSNLLLRQCPAIAPDEATIADLLRDHGYTTQMVGKWHLGFGKASDDPGLLTDGPLDCGFDYFQGTEHSNLSGSYIKGRRLADAIDPDTHNELLCDDAVRVIRNYAASKQEKKLFLYYALYEPHTPLIPGKQFIGKSKAGEYGDYVVQLDHWVGRITQALKESDLEQNTIVIFASDNGSLTRSARFPKHQPNYIFSGGKAKPHEGGHRLPFIVRWPGVVAADTVCDATISQTDFFATLADHLGVDPAAEYPGAAKDSYSFLSLLKNPAANHERPPLIAVGSYRKDNWKIIVNGEWLRGTSDGDFAPAELYNLETDISEQNNCLKKNPEIANELFAEFKSMLLSRQLKGKIAQPARKKTKAPSKSRTRQKGAKE